MATLCTFVHLILDQSLDEEIIHISERKHICKHMLVSARLPHVHTIYLEHWQVGSLQRQVAFFLTIFNHFERSRKGPKKVLGQKKVKVTLIYYLHVVMDKQCPRSTIVENNSNSISNLNWREYFTPGVHGVCSILDSSGWYGKRW